MSEQSRIHSPDLATATKSAIEKGLVFTKASLRVEQLGVAGLISEISHNLWDSWVLRFSGSDNGFTMPRWVNQDRQFVHDGLGDGPTRYMEVELMYTGTSEQDCTPLLDSSQRLQVKSLSVDLYGSYATAYPESTPGSRDLLNRRSLYIDTSDAQRPSIKSYNGLSRQRGQDLLQFRYDCNSWPSVIPTEDETVLLTDGLQVVNHYLGQGALILDRLHQNITRTTIGVSLES